MDKVKFTHHARYRCRTRAIPESAIEAAIDYGRHFYSKGADHYIIGWREVRYWANRGVDLSRYRDIEVVCAAAGQVVTTYRNRKHSRRGRKHGPRAA